MTGFEHNPFLNTLIWWKSKRWKKKSNLQPKSQFPFSLAFLCAKVLFSGVYIKRGLLRVILKIGKKNQGERNKKKKELSKKEWLMRFLMRLKREPISVSGFGFSGSPPLSTISLSLLLDFFSLLLYIEVNSAGIQIVFIVRYSVFLHTHFYINLYVQVLSREREKN